MKTLNLPEDIADMDTLKRGDTFPGLEFTFTDSTGAPLNVTDYNFLFQIRRKQDRNSELLKEVTVFTRSATNKAAIPKFLIDFAWGQFYYEVELTTDTGDVRTFVGGLFTIENDLAWKLT
jgi:hypothetical protein